MIEPNGGIKVENHNNSLPKHKPSQPPQIQVKVESVQGEDKKPVGLGPIV
jgi:hypothetical protein